MGYLIKSIHSSFFLSNENKSKAYDTIKEWVTDEEDGIIYGDFLWVDIDLLEEATTIEEQLKAWRWSPKNDSYGNIISVEFVGEKEGEDEEFLSVLAPYVRPNSYIEMEGEDGAMWKWIFDGKCCNRVD